MPHRPLPTLRTCRGPRACEAALLDDLGERCAGDPTQRLERPLLVVVPSRSLRQHLLLRSTQRLGPALLGVTCRTLHHVAIDLLERSGKLWPVNGGMVDLLARRFAKHQPVLRRSLEGLEEGYRTVAVTVRSLLEAGLEPALVDGLSEELAASGRAVASAAQVDRARAIVEVAARVHEEMERLGIAHSSSLLRQAADLLRGAAPDLPGWGSVSVIGFADATGVASDLIEALLVRYAGTLYLDRPPDPAKRRADDSGNAFSRRFSERMAASAVPASDSASDSSPPEIHMFRAVGAASEVREVARRVRSLIAIGIAPEEIGIVARRLEPYRFAMREELDTLGVPYSGFDARGPREPGGRRLVALLELLRHREATPIDRWLEIQGGLGTGASRVLLRQALLCLGAGRLGEVSTLRHEPLLREGRYALPVRRGFDEFEGDEEGATPRVLVRRSSVSGDRLELARRAARHLLRRLAKIAEADTRERLESELRALVERELAWSETEQRDLEAAIEIAGRGLAAGWPLALEEWADLLAPAAEAASASPLGGAGGGVQLLDVIESRGRTFGYLFVLGLNRGTFPRVVLEDPLLPDSLRHVLGRSGFGLLPDLALKADGHAEERYLFAQLLDAADQVTLSWQEADEEGARLTPSPLVERLRWRTEPAAPAQWREPPMAPHRLSVPALEAGPRPAREAAMLAGLHGGRASYARLLPLALEESGRDAARARDLGAARVRLLDEIDPDLRTPDGRGVRARLGPYFGWIGAASESGDPRGSAGGEIPVTTLESLSRCPWQTFLTRILRLEPAADPLELLPAIEGRLIGSLVHDVLEAIVRQGTGPADELGEALARLPFGIPWPGSDELDRLVREAAARLVAREGIALQGFDRALAAVVAPHLEHARRLDWEAAEGPPAIAAELHGAVEMGEPGSPLRRLRFRADRVDRQVTASHAALRMTDYKTGRRPLAERSDKIEEAVRDKIRSGESLQGAAYALARGVPGDSGRYLYLHPDLAGVDPPREIEVSGADPEVRELFEATVGTLIEAWDGGVFFPRLVRADRDKEPELCSYCRVAEACLRGDSGARGRLRDWTGERREAEAPPGDEASWMATWLLDSSPPKRSGR